MESRGLGVLYIFVVETFRLLEYVKVLSDVRHFVLNSCLQCCDLV